MGPIQWELDKLRAAMASVRQEEVVGILEEIFARLSEDDGPSDMRGVLNDLTCLLQRSREAVGLCSPKQVH